MDPVQESTTLDLSKAVIRDLRTSSPFVKLFSHNDPTGCKDGNCPSVYSIAGSSDVLIQGFTLGTDRGQLNIPNNEEVVRVPRALIDRIAAAIKDGQL